MKEVYSGVAEALDGIYTATVAGTYRPTVGANQMIPLVGENHYCITTANRQVKDNTPRMSWV